MPNGACSARSRHGHCRYLLAALRLAGRCGPALVRKKTIKSIAIWALPTFTLFGVAADTDDVTLGEALRAIAAKEFTLNHLDPADRNLLDEALRHSGIEVHHHCIVEQKAEQTEKYLLMPRQHQKFHVRHHPSLGFKDLSSSEEPETGEPEWKDVPNPPTQYPFPFELALDDDILSIHRLLPMDLSSVRPVARDDTSVRYTALPSRVLLPTYVMLDIVEVATPVDFEMTEAQFAEARTEMQEIVEGMPRESFSIDFVVDIQSRRMATMTVQAKKTVRVDSMRIRELKIDYELAWDEIANRHVVKGIREEYRGSLARVLRGRVLFETRFSYVDCLEEPPVWSYLYQQVRGLALQTRLPSAEAR